MNASNRIYKIQYAVLVITQGQANQCRTVFEKSRRETQVREKKVTIKC